MKKRIYSIITSAVIFISVFILCSAATTGQFNDKINTNIVNNSNCPGGYTYIKVIENGITWIYVYCGDVLVERYVQEDF